MYAIHAGPQWFSRKKNPEEYSFRKNQSYDRKHMHISGGILALASIRDFL